MLYSLCIAIIAFLLEFPDAIIYPGYMRGIAEEQDGLSRKLVNSLRLGEEYTLDDFAKLLGQQRNAVTRKGVLTSKGSDAQLLLITLEKDQYSTPGYIDHIEGSTLFWTGQNSIKAVEKNLQNGSHDTFIFAQERRKTPYVVIVRLFQPCKDHR